MSAAPGTLADRLRRWRHNLHQIPETGLAEHRTSDYLAAELSAMGLEVTRGIGGTGLVATVRGSSTSDGDPRAIGLRADMDGLTLPERNALPYRSRHDGTMHACGHDGHMAMVLGAGHVLASEGGFAGAVHLVFQPAEEHGLGAKAMIADGLFDRFPVDGMFGLHNWPGLAAGRISTRVGDLMAGEDNFEIRIAGRGGHASQPQMVVDPMVVAAQIVLGLQTIVARNVHPADTAVVSCTEVVTDGARNAIPSEVVIRGDARSFTIEVQALLERRMRELCDGICAAHGATCTVSYTHEFEPTINDAVATALALAAARLTVPEDHVDPDSPPFMGSEDFGAFGRVVQSCFAMLGNGVQVGAGGTPLQSHDYDFNDEILETGVAYYVNLARTALPTRGGDVSAQYSARPWLPNPARDRTWTCSPVPRDVMDFHRGLAEYAATRLVDLPTLAAELGVGRVLVKDESYRLGLPAFKSLGASWAIHRVEARLRSEAEGPSGSPVTLVAATDGNHGRAVARFSRLLGHRARIFVPDGVHPAAVQAIRDEGADVTTVPADYDEAVRTAARYAADSGGVLVQDTAWHEYEEVPGWIVDGYSTLFRELDDQLADLGIEQPDMVLVPTGVGSLLQACLTHYRAHPAGADTAVVSVEPVQAACVQASIAAGHPVGVATGHTIMAGLNCGTVSSLAWPCIHRGLDATAAVTDEQASLAARALAKNGVPVGPCGAAPLAAARTLATRWLPDAGDLGHRVSSGATLVLIATEGESANPAAPAPVQA